MIRGWEANELLAERVEGQGRYDCFALLVLHLSWWLLVPRVASRCGSATSPSSALANLPTAPPTSTRWTAPPVRAARPTATTACAWLTRSSASSFGDLVRTLLSFTHRFWACLPPGHLAWPRTLASEHLQTPPLLLLAQGRHQGQSGDSILPSPSRLLVWTGYWIAVPSHTHTNDVETESKRKCKRPLSYKRCLTSAILKENKL